MSMACDYKKTQQTLTVSINISTAFNRLHAYHIARDGNRQHQISRLEKYKPAS